MALKVGGGPEGCLDAIGDIDLFEDSVKMCLYGMETDTKPVCDLVIGCAHGDQGKDFGLSFGEVPGGALCRRITFFENALGHHLPGEP